MLVHSRLLTRSSRLSCMVLPDWQHFPIAELRNPSIGVSKLHKIRPVFFEALKNVQSGISFNATGCTTMQPASAAVSITLYLFFYSYYSPSSPALPGMQNSRSLSGKANHDWTMAEENAQLLHAVPKEGKEKQHMRTTNSKASGTNSNDLISCDRSGIRL